MKAEELKDDDKIALAEAYRAYEFLTLDARVRVPQDFVNFMLKNGDFKNVKTFKNYDEFKMYQMSEKGKALTAYICTF